MQRLEISMLLPHLAPLTSCKMQKSHKKSQVLLLFCEECTRNRACACIRTNTICKLIHICKYPVVRSILGLSRQLICNSTHLKFWYFSKLWPRSEAAITSYVCLNMFKATIFQGCSDNLYVHPHIVKARVIQGYSGISYLKLLQGQKLQNLNFLN